jgi:hypothetical protein
LISSQDVSAVRVERSSIAVALVTSR